MENNKIINNLTKFLVENTLGKKIGILGGSFKPPQSGHFQIVKSALDQNKDLDEFIVFVGNAERGGINQEQSTQIWNIYKKYLSDKVKIVPTNKSPIHSIYDFTKENPGIEVIWILGIREDNEEDKADYKKRTSAIKKYPNLKTLVINTEDNNISGTNARIALKKGKDEFFEFLPTELSEEDKEKIWEILNKKEQIKESEVGTKDDVDDANFKYLPYIPYYDILMPKVKEDLGEESELYQELFNYFMNHQGGNVRLSEIIKILKDADYYHEFYDRYKHLLQLNENKKYLKIFESMINPKDVIKVDVPLFIRLLEYAREDAKSDLDLHNVAENIINLSEEGKVLNMEDYNEIIGSNLNEIIQKQGKQWVVKSKDGKKILGKHPNKKKALAQLRAIEINKVKETSLEQTYLVEGLNKIDFKKYVKYLDEIVNYCCKDLNIPRPKVKIINNENYSQENKSFGGYVPGKGEIYLVIKNRNLSDVGRTLAHEIRHMKQDLDGVLNEKSGKDGSEHENECNAYSGKIMREFNRKYPEIMKLNNGE